ncbi:hypothetical protein SEPCBS119000_004252 [Sporothrix epigloea]|uniref:FAD-binding FR-type domain-containing protein n=1 Tax=Sporothrix epigloea TaxID=1892477 RepID=A0ABP0DU08_9PEZI
MKCRDFGDRALLSLILLAATTWPAGTTAHGPPTDDASHVDTPFPPRYISHAGLSIGRPPVIVRADPDTCFQACRLAIAAPAYTDLQHRAPYRQEACYSKLLRTSMYLCLREYCSDGRGIDGLDRLNATCIRSGQAALPPMDEVLADYPPDKLKQMRRLQRNECNSDTHLSAPVLLSQQLYENSYDTLADLDYARLMNSYYSHAIILFWAVVILFGMVNRLFKSVVQALRRRRNGLPPTIGRQTSAYHPVSQPVIDDDLDEYCESEDVFGSKNSYAEVGRSLARRPRVWLQRHLTTPATFGYKASQDFGWYTVPPRVQAVTIAGFIILNMLAMVSGYHAFTGNIWPTITQQLLRYASDRNGIISFLNFPIIWLFGMRNNALLWLTGWDFGTYNNFHRWVARVATVEAIVHSIGYTTLVCRDGGLPELLRWWRMFFWWTGGVATICMSLLLGLSLFYLRRNMYEAFLIIHIVFSIAILFGMLAHVSIFRGTYDFFFWACLIVWVADRVMRAIRIIAFNPLFWTTRATATYDTDSNIIRVVVPYNSSFYQPKPGTFYYLHVLNDKRFWESHPFTVATVTTLNKSIGEDLSALSDRRRSLPQAVELDDQSDVLTEHDSPLVDKSDVTANLSIRQVKQAMDEPAGLPYNGNYGSIQSPNPPQTRPSSSHTAKTSCSITSSFIVPPSARAASAMTFLIRPYDGFTGRLRDKAAAAANPDCSPSGVSATCVTSQPAPAQLRVLVDGPYGHSQNFSDDYDSLLFVVGGSGIVVPISHLTGIGHNHTLSPKRRRRLKRIHIVWAVREAEFAAQVLREDLNDVFGTDGEETGSTIVTLDIHVTSSKPVAIATADETEPLTGLGSSVDHDDVDGNDGREAASQHCAASIHRPGKDRPRSPDDSLLGVPLPHAVQVHYERPDVRGEVECAAGWGRKSSNCADRRLAVIACGPGRMADEARRTVIDVLGRRGVGHIDYLEESFQW